MHTTPPPPLAATDALPARWEVRGTLAAPVDDVAALLFAVAEGRVGDDNLLVLATASAARRGAMSVVAGPGAGAYRTELAGPLEPVRIQLGTNTMAVQSWYAGVYTATAAWGAASGAASGHTEVVHRVHRVLPDHPGFTDGIADLGLRARMARDLRRTLGIIADRLDC